MDMTGEYRIAAPRQTVWEALNDPEVLKQCIPGCDEIEKRSDTEFAAKVTAKVGPVKARFAGKVTLSDLDPPLRRRARARVPGERRRDAGAARTDGAAAHQDLRRRALRHHGPQGILARTWPTGSTVLWVSVLLAMCLLFYY